MLDFHDETVRGRLSRAVKSSYEALRPFRELNRALVKEYAGPGYGAGEVRHEMYLNLIHQAVEAYTMALAANCPRILVSTQIPSQKAFAKHFQTATNNLIQEIGLKHTLRRWLIDAFFCVGVVKVHLADSALVEIEQDVWMDPGIPYASNVSLDDFVYDTGAKTLGQCKFFGDMYRIPFADLQSGQYDTEAIKDLRPTSKAPIDGDRLDDISRGRETDKDEFEPMIDLCDVYIPRQKTIYTFAVKNRSTFDLWGPPLADMPWTGSEQGCYHLLGFTDVPENIMPASPADQLASLSRLVNILMRKQARRARNQKDLNLYTPAAADSAKRSQRAADGDWIQVQDPNEISVIKQGGVDPNNQVFMLNAVQMFDRAAGNLQALLGLGSQAGTASQEQLIHSAASKKVSSMQILYVEAMKRLIKDIGQLLWDDEFKTIPAEMSIPGAEGITVDATWNPLDREGSFLDYNFEIDVYSLSYQTPSQRMSGVTQAVTQIFAPLAPLLQQQGGTIDLGKLSEMMAEMMSEPRIRDIIQFNRPQSDEPEPQQPLSKSATSSREYVRRNVSTQNQTDDMTSDWASISDSNASV